MITTTSNIALAPRRPTTRRAHRSIALVASAGVLLIASACGDGDAADSTTPVASTTVAATTTAPTTAAPTAAAPTTVASPSTTVTPTTSDDTDRRDVLAGILQSHLAAGEFVGARITFADRDGNVTEVTAGTQTTDPGSPPVELDIPWGIGSATKTFVATVVLQLADEGRIDLDAGIDGFFPDLADADRITPRELLQHTSGIGEYLDQPAVLADTQREWSVAELVGVAEAGGRVGEPGESYHYSNTNYLLLGEIIEQVTGHPWFDEVRTRILQPLDLHAVSVIGTSSSSAPGYTVVDGSFVDATTSLHPSLGGAAGGLQATGRDLLRFASALADGTLLSAESRAAMEQFVPGEDYSQFGVTHAYGLGLERWTSGAVTVFGHLGSGAAQSSFFGYDPDHGTAIAVTMNTNTPGPQALIAFEALTALLEG